MTRDDGNADRQDAELPIPGMLPPARRADTIDRAWLDRSGLRLLVAWTRGRGNPFTTLLYSRGLEHGYASAHCPVLADLPAVPRVAGTVFHFHWLKTLTDDAKVEEFARVLAALKRGGGRIVWTAHNVLPHDTSDVERATRVRKLMVEASDAIHIMNRDTPDLVEPHYTIRHKPIFYSPHPSYLGAYPDTVTPEEARFQLGLSPTSVVFLCFGALLPYKGMDMLVAGAERLARQNPDLEWQLLVAGDPLVGAPREMLLGSAALRDRLVSHARVIPVVEVEYYFKAADYCVLPYQRTINSGIAQLAMSFGVPVIVPETSAFGEIPRHARLTYPPDDVLALTATLERAVATDRTAMRKNALGFARSRRPEKASAIFFEALSAALP